MDRTDPRIDPRMIEAAVEAYLHSGTTVDLAGQTLCVPLRPADAPEGWGLDRPGMIGRRVDGGLPPPEPN